MLLLDVLADNKFAVAILLPKSDKKSITHWIEFCNSILLSKSFSMSVTAKNYHKPQQPLRIKRDR
jgi:hypothetical protein